MVDKCTCPIDDSFGPLMHMPDCDKRRAYLKKEISMIELVNYRTDEGLRCAFVKHGTKWSKVLTIDAGKQSGLVIHKVPKTDQRYMTPLLHKGKPYPIKRALRHFRKFGKTHGITGGAKKLLQEVAKAA